MSGVLDRFRLDGQTVLITGAGTGLGAGMARVFAEAGADIAVVGRRADKLAETCSAIKSAGRKAVAIAADLMEEGTADRVAKEAVEALGTLTVLVNNVGGSPDKPPRLLLDVTEASWSIQLAQNLTAAWRMTKAAVPLMTSGGAILNISSIRGMTRHGGPSGAYGAAKAALNSMTADLAVDLAPRFRVNGIAPGPIPSEGFLRARGLEAPTPEVQADFAKQFGIPLGRLGTPDDVAAAALLLVSPAGEWITGQTIVVSGGL